MGLSETKYKSAEEYLEIERTAFEKSEYFRGEIFAMSGASLAHNRISTNCIYNLANKLRGKSSVPYGSDLRIHIPENSLYTYPDLSIICGEVENTDEKFDTVTNPSVIIEILSKTTRGYDQGDKFGLYRKIKSLKEYVLIDSENFMVQKHIRNSDESWLLTEYNSLEQSFKLETVKIELLLSDIYEGVRLITNEEAIGENKKL